MADLRSRVEAMPREPGVYLWKGPAGEVLYVGKAADLRARTRQYLVDASAKGSRLMSEADDLEFIAVRNEKEALILEQTLIKRHRPRFNVRLTDDKQYPYLWLTPGPYPRLVKMHGRRGKGGTWFGPFPDGYGAFHVLQTLNDLLPLRKCKTLPNQKCLYYDIGKCVAPCIQACTDEEYDALVRQASDILTGRSSGFMRALEERLKQAATDQRFEEAARLRDQIQGLRGTLERQHMVAAHLEDRDIASLAGQGDAGVVSLLHQRDGKVVGQSIYTVAGLAETSDPLGDFLRGFYADRPVPRNVTVDPFEEPAEAAQERAARLEADLRSMSGHAVRVEAPVRGDKRRWVEVARKNGELRAQEESIRRTRRGQGALEALQTHLGLPDPPRRIEGFDISHLAGQHTRAAMVSFLDGEPDKASYRTFNMRTVGEAAVAAGRALAKGHGREVDDFASMYEAVHRRYARLREEQAPLPDLIVIDGGPGQLAAAQAALKAAFQPHIPDDASRPARTHPAPIHPAPTHPAPAVPAVCSLAKKEEEVHTPGRMRPLRLPRNDPGLQLLQRVRDEAHRFGIRQVRAKSTRSVTSSPLDAVPGIGPKRRQQLVQSFGGLEGLRAASIEDLTAVRGVTMDTARRIHEILHADEAANGVAVDDAMDD